MRIGIIGYGRMGKIVEEIARERGHEIAAIVDPRTEGATHSQVDADTLKGLEGVIEFSLPEGILPRLKLYAQAGLKAVVGTTGWNGELGEGRAVFEKAASSGGRAALLTGSNFSPGAHMLFRLAAKLSQMLNRLPSYDIMIHEYHHARKIDSPSGTALSLAKAVLDHSQRKKQIVTEPINGAPISEDELHVTSTRGGSIPGIHSLLADGIYDSLELVHNARGREGFAEGSVLALEWLENRNSCFSADDFFDDLFQENT